MTIQVPADVLTRGCVRVDVSGSQSGVVTVTLDRPDARNAQTPATWAALDVIGQALEDAPVSLVVIRGAGSAFSAGLDRRMFTPDGVPGETSLAAMTAMADAQFADQIGIFQRGFTWQRRVRALTVAAVQGPAVGAGFQLALACDMLIATPEATFAMRETSYGLVPDLGGTQPLVRAVGYARAVDICATGRAVTAAEGYALGFVTRVVDDLDAAVDELASVVGETPPGAVADVLALLSKAEEATRDEQLVEERTAQVRRLRNLLGGS